MKEYNSIIMSGNRITSRSYNDYKELMLIFIRVLCGKTYKSKIVEYVKKSYYPIPECLKICEEKNMIEAQAVLTKRKGEY